MVNSFTANYQIFICNNILFVGYLYFLLYNLKWFIYSLLLSLMQLQNMNNLIIIFSSFVVFKLNFRVIFAKELSSSEYRKF